MSPHYIFASRTRLVSPCALDVKYFFMSFFVTEEAAELSSEHNLLSSMCERNASRETHSLLTEEQMQYIFHKARNFPGHVVDDR
jgi:hypothetical protein